MTRFVLVLVAAKSGTTLHERLLKTVMRYALCRAKNPPPRGLTILQSPIISFYNNRHRIDSYEVLKPLTHGNISLTLDRFSQDIGMIDNHLPLGLVVTIASKYTTLQKDTPA